MNVENAVHDAHYFVPSPSRWPIVGALALFCLGLGAALTINQVASGRWVLLIGFGVLLWMLIGWFSDVVHESESGSYGQQVDYSFRWGMSWFIFSEVMFFAAFFGALFYTRTISVPELGFLAKRSKCYGRIFRLIGQSPQGPNRPPIKQCTHLAYRRSIPPYC